MSSKLRVALTNLQNAFAEADELQNSNDIQQLLDVRERLDQCREKLFSTYNRLETDDLVTEDNVKISIYLENGDDVDDADIAISIAWKKSTTLQNRINLIYSRTLNSTRQNLQLIPVHSEL